MALTAHIPTSVQAEHAAIHEALATAARTPGQVGEAARALVHLLQPHWVREEEIALPPLGLLAPLAAGEWIEDDTAATVIAMTDALRHELPRMLEEHARIRLAVDVLRHAAAAQRLEEFQRLADQLVLHARTEEEVLYPAAMLVGEMIRARRGRQI